MSSLSSTSAPRDQAAPTTVASAPDTEDAAFAPSSVDENSKQKEKRKFFGLLKKKNQATDTIDDSAGPTTSTLPVHPTTSTNSQPKAIPRSVSPHMSPSANATQLPASSPSHVGAASPSRYVRSSSPRLHSPASSLIFERNVQEAPLPDELQAAIPHHIQTEDYIPPILEASSHAITDEKLNPDEVEIVMHSLHQPAASTVPHAESTLGSGALSPLSLGHGSDVPTLSPSALQDGASDEHAPHYGSLDSTDVRRLSFISFADVVQAEHALEGSGSGSIIPKDLQMSMISSTTNRSPSPVRSPASSHGPGDFGLSPPTSGTPSMQGVDISGKQPIIGAFPASPGSGTHSPPLITGSAGELKVETMRQALRKTGSGDLSAARSPVSPIDRNSFFPSNTNAHEESK